MVIASLPVMLSVAIAGLSVAFSSSAELRQDGYSPYRLTVEGDPFRLVAPGLLHPPTKTQTIHNELKGKPYAALIHSAATSAALEPALVHAIISVESGYRSEARSHKGAIGLMQVMPATALRYGIKDPGRSLEDNLKAGTLYLKDLMRQFNNRLDLVLAAYNAGENAVLRHGGQIPPYGETRRYVPAVLEKYHAFRQPPAVVEPVPPRFEYISGTRLDQRQIGLPVEQPAQSIK